MKYKLLIKNQISNSKQALNYKCNFNTSTYQNQSLLSKVNLDSKFLIQVHCCTRAMILDAYGFTTFSNRERKIFPVNS